jgi:hypothetical protein
MAEIDEIEEHLRTMPRDAYISTFEDMTWLIARIHAQAALLKEARETLVAYKMCNVGCGDCDPLRDLLAKLDEALKP